MISDIEVWNTEPRENFQQCRSGRIFLQYFHYISWTQSNSLGSFGGYNLKKRQALQVLGIGLELVHFGIMEK